MMVAGIGIGIVYQLFAALRKVFESVVFAVCSDIVFWFVAAFVCIFCLVTFNNAQVRAYAVLGFGAGAYLYTQTVGKLFRFLYRRIVLAYNNGNKIIQKIFK